MSLLGLALAWGWIFPPGPWSGFHFSFGGLMVGALAALPPWACLIWAMRSDLRIFASHRRLMDQVVLPLFANWPLWQCAMISAVAGISEETFFRGTLQRTLTGWFGPQTGLVLTALAFGAAHPISWTYALFAAAVGAYLGWLWLWTGGLPAPITAHAVYDLLALTYFLRHHRPTDPKYPPPRS